MGVSVADGVTLAVRDGVAVMDVDDVLDTLVLAVCELEVEEVRDFVGVLEGVREDVTLTVGEGVRVGDKEMEGVRVGVMLDEGVSDRDPDSDSDGVMEGVSDGDSVEVGVRVTVAVGDGVSEAVREDEDDRLVLSVALGVSDLELDTDLDDVTLMLLVRVPDTETDALRDVEDDAVMLGVNDVLPVTDLLIVLVAVVDAGIVGDDVGVGEELKADTACSSANSTTARTDANRSESLLRAVRRLRRSMPAQQTERWITHGKPREPTAEYGTAKPKNGSNDEAPPGAPTNGEGSQHRATWHPHGPGVCMPHYAHKQQRDSAPAGEGSVPFENQAQTWAWQTSMPTPQKFFPMESGDVPMPAAAAAAGGAGGSSGAKFEVKRWNAVALWAWGACHPLTRPPGGVAALVQLLGSAAARVPDPCWCGAPPILVLADIVVDNCAICRNHIMDLCAYL